VLPSDITAVGRRNISIDSFYAKLDFSINEKGRLALNGIDLTGLITWQTLLRMSKSAKVFFKGLFFHVGSQVLDLQAYTDAIDSIIHYLDVLQKHSVTIDTLKSAGDLVLINRRRRAIALNVLPNM
jgi:diaminopimelate decarboxylase